MPTTSHRAPSGQSRKGRRALSPTPSPGEILRQAKVQADGDGRAVRDTGAVASRVVYADPFQDDVHVTLRQDRGVVLAPLMVTWRYRVAAARPFAKWLRTKDMLLSNARFGIQSETAGIRYFGTYIEQDGPAKACDDGRAPDEDVSVGCETLWGFTDEAAMHHMFDLSAGRVPRVSIVEFDLRDFISGLKRHVREGGVEHFSQHVSVASAAL